MPAKDNQPLQIRPSRELLKRLDDLTLKFKRESTNKLAVEILRDCVDMWEKASQAFEDTLTKQAQEALKIKNAMLNRTIFEAEAATETRHNTKRKPK